ncbi:mitochondrial import inner membrane translocase subunit Tim9 [Senna tora]|uniref:Mitochondrial import inner membrane translocase subunit n=1 Tax=Senna tora TaxID=362788 RepID=A0A835CME0_9FABA|nr:mitochondrial import inner membrane translocase subunit Tim9 [Senna tora]
MDKNMFADLDSLSGEEKERMSTMIDQLQIRDRFSSLSVLCMLDVVLIYSLLKQNCSLRMYNSLVERCFTDCVHSFYRKSLTKQEETCVNRCAEKFSRHSVLLGLRFSELSQGASTKD